MGARPAKGRSSFVVLRIETQSAEGDRYAPQDWWDERSQKRLVDLLSRAREHARQNARQATPRPTPPA
jgi:hypothetical protein